MIKRLTVDLTEEEHAALKSEVPKVGKTMREVIRELISTWLKERQQAPKQT